MKWDEFVKLALELPEVAESSTHGRPSLKVRGKYIASYNLESKAFSLRIANVEEQDFLCEMAPEIYFITPHFKGYPALLARPNKLTKKEARGRLLHAWRIQAPKALVKKFDAG